MAPSSSQDYQNKVAAIRRRQHNQYEPAYLQEQKERRTLLLRAILFERRSLDSPFPDNREYFAEKACELYWEAAR